MEKITYLESDRRREVHEEVASLEKPVFGRPLRNAALAEGQSAHLEATLTPVNDATMKVEWFYNGRPIPQGELRDGDGKVKVGDLLGSLVMFGSDSNMICVAKTNKTVIMPRNYCQGRLGCSHS